MTIHDRSSKNVVYSSYLPPDPVNCKIRYTSARQNSPPGISPVTGDC